MFVQITRVMRINELNAVTRTWSRRACRKHERAFVHGSLAIPDQLAASALEPAHDPVRYRRGRWRCTDARNTRRSPHPGRGQSTKWGRSTLNAAGSRARSRRVCAPLAYGGAATGAWLKRACKVLPSPRHSTSTGQPRGSPSAHSPRPAPHALPTSLHDG